MKKLLLPILLFSQLSFAQQANDSAKTNAGAVKIIDENNALLDGLKRLKFSGLIQAQFQFASAVGIKTASGPEFPANSNYRFSVRRGRLKTVYTGNYTQYVLQFDVSENGFAAKDVYMEISDPWKKGVSVTGGLFFRPFGYELELSETVREPIERSRMIQILFPGERDLGAMIKIAPNTTFLKNFNFKGGLFAGNGISTDPKEVKENDKNKDFIGRFGFHLPIEMPGLTINGGISAYVGRVIRDYDVNGIKKYGSYFINKTDKSFHTWDTAAWFPSMKRQYMGFDLQVGYDIPILGPMSLRSEYIFGVQPGTSTSSGFYRSYFGNGDLYMRNFNGYYINFSQYIGKKNQLFLRYDSYDPNIDIKGSDIGITGSRTGAADVKFSTLGLGWGYIWDNNFKFIVYYEFVKNETCSALSGYNKDRPDNILTIRMQYKF